MPTSTRSSSHQKRSLIQLITRRVTAVTFVAVSLLTASMMFLLHRSIHEQTDNLLLRLAEEDALGAQHDDAGAHLHDAAIATPTLQATVVDKYALILNEHCDILDRTSNLPHPVFPPSICPSRHPVGARSVLFLEELGDEALRVAIVYEQGPDGRPAAFVVGIPHKDVDRSVWRSTFVAIPLAFLAAIFIIAALWLTTKPSVRELEELSRAVNLLESSDPLGSLSTAIAAVKKTPQTSNEMAILATALQQAFEELQHAAERRSRFIAEASHELRTPLTVMRGELEVTLRRDRSNEAYREALQIALDSTLTLQALTEHLLEVSRNEEQRATMRRIDLRSVVRDALKSRQELFESAGVRIDWQPPSQEIPVQADFQLALRALSNLLDNALSHAQPTRVHIRLRTEKDRVVLSVLDDGRGIDPDTVLVLFDPFGRNTESAGHGLGLYLVRTLMRAQNGEAVWIGDGLEGQGAGFELLFLIF